MPDKQDSQHQHDERDERDRRIEALRSLAGEPGQQTPQQTNGPPVIASQEATPARRQVSGLRGHKRVTLVAIAVLLVMAVAGGLVAHSVISPASKSTQPTLTSLIISPAESNFSCPRDIAWSPKSTSLALLGYQGYCAQSVPTIYSYHPGIIILDDITSGKQTSTLHPDDSIAAALGLKPPTVATPMSGVAPADRNTSRQVIDYGHLLWSPDGKQLAVTFTVSVATAEAGSTNFVTSVTDGVLLMSPSGGETRILSHRRASGEVYSGHWNLSTSTYIPLPVASPSPDDSNGNWYANVALIPPSLRYQWNNAGELLPVAPLNTTSAPVSQQAAPVGLADGGKEFTVWQPGVAQIITHNHAEPPRPLKAPVETWQTSFASWSADGSYVFAGNWEGRRWKAGVWHPMDNHRQMRQPWHC